MIMQDSRSSGVLKGFASLQLRSNSLSTALFAESRPSAESSALTCTLASEVVSGRRQRVEGRHNPTTLEFGHEIVGRERNVQTSTNQFLL